MYDNVAANNVLYGNVDCSGTPRQIAIEVRRTVILRDNLVTTDDPGLTLTEDRRFCPVVGSAVVDAGAFIARTTSGGSGRRVPVDDTSWFSDGYGVVDGDEIRFLGSDRPIRIVAVDDATLTIVLSEEVSWNKNQGIHLWYEGAAPDLGAFEFGSAQCDDGHNSGNSH